MNELMFSTLLGAFFVVIGILSEKMPQIIAGYDRNKPDKETPKRIRKVLVLTGILIIVGCTIAYILEQEMLFWIFLIISPIIVPFLLFIDQKNRLMFGEG